MSDYIGDIEVPTISPDGTFPVVPDYPHGRALNPDVVIHQFGSGNAKMEQRFYLGNGARRFFVRKAVLNASDLDDLRSFWENTYGPYGAFTYNAPNDNGVGTTEYTCRFADEPLSWKMLADGIATVGVTLVEIPDEDPAYSVNATLTRFPSSTLKTGLLAQVQEIIPLVKITAKDSGYDEIYLSDRRCAVGGQLYLPRLLDFDGISQSIGNEADQARFVFGNADRVMRDLANDVDLFRAMLEFSLFHVETGIKLDLWKGEVVDWTVDAGPEFHVTAADGLYELNLPYPCRRISRTCWKDLDDGNSCPATAEGGINLGEPCDKGFDTPKGCQYHGMDNRFGGIIAKPQAVRNKDNSTGTWGYGRSGLTSVSLVADSIYGEVVPEVYTDTPMPVNAKIAAGRDEGDFYTALGIVGEGPIAAFGSGHKLDGQEHHGPGNLGLRTSLGPDPNTEPFSLGAGGDGVQTYGDVRAAGTAFVEIRRSDAKGLQLSRLGEHAIQAVVLQGLKGWVWTGAGSRTSQLLTNPVWVAVNMMLHARGLRFASAATCEQYFDVDSAVAAAAVCNQTVNSLFPKRIKNWIVDVTGHSNEYGEWVEEEGHWEDDELTTETQFKFIGTIQEEKPLRDWIQEVLMNCLGYYTFAFGKLKIGVRVNSSVVEAFTVGNIIHQSLQLAPAKPSFNHLSANFADDEFDFVANAVQVYDIDHAKTLGASSPLFLKSTMNLSGTCTKSQAARLVSIRMREELGGISAAEWKAAREVGFRTTVLALNADPGMVCSMTHDDMPDGAGEFRVQGWKLNRDFSIDIQGRTTTDSMYDLVTGPKPADVPADPVPVEQTFAPEDWNFEVATDKDGNLLIRNLSCKGYGEGVDRAVFEVYYIPEDEVGYSATSDTIPGTETDLDIEMSGEPMRDGEWALLEQELLAIDKVVASGVNMSTASVRRGSNVFGDAANVAAAHAASMTEIAAVDSGTNAIVTIETGLPIKPGWILYLVPIAPSIVVEWQYVSDYDPTTGVCKLVKPFDVVEVGQECQANPRVWRVTAKTLPVNLGAGFFRRPDRARYTVEIPLQFAGVVAVRGYLETRFGDRSNAVLKLFTVDAPHRLRTLGTTQYLMRHPGLTAGETEDAFQSIRVETTQSFERAFAQRTGGISAPPLPAPRSVATGSPSAFEYGGTITIAGTPALGDTISISVGDPGSEAAWLRVPLYEVKTTNRTNIAATLAIWLNAYEPFAAFYSAESSGVVVQITDRRGGNGEIATEVSGGVTAAAVGITSNLEINLGRRYALTFSGDGLESEPGPLSYPTGPTGGATRVEISDLPRTADDERVDTLRVWAAPDGADSPLYLVGSVAVGEPAIADTWTDTQLKTKTEYDAAVQPEASGPVTAMVKKDGSPWFELRIPEDGARSNVIDGLALNNVPQGTEVTVDLNNQAETLDLDVVIE
jgi:hypothetical protein